MVQNIKKLFSMVGRFIVGLPRLYSVGGAVLLVAAIAVGSNAITRAPAEATVTSGVSHVQLASVGDLSSSAGPLPITGKVTSQSEAKILAQASGGITALNRALGDYVAGGTVIAQFENASERAAVTQAEGSYDAALAALGRVTGSTSVNAANVTTVALQSAYSALDDAIRTRADEHIVNASTNPLLALVVPDSMLVNRIQNQRQALSRALDEARVLANVTNPTNLVALGMQMAGYLTQTLTFLNDLVEATNNAVVSPDITATEIGTYQTSLAAARAEVITALSGLSSAKSAYDANDVRAAEAAVKQAQGALSVAKANLENTVIRSPISGTIVSLPIAEGDYISANTQVAVVSNPNALYVEAEITSLDAKTLAVGNKALIEGTTPGRITFIAPALDPMTGKIKVKISVTGTPSALTNGEITTVLLDRASKATTPAATTIVIPIIAAKISPAGPIVFTVDENSTLRAKPITLGSILGDRVVILTGLERDTKIVTDARGLSDGQVVIVDPSL